MGGQTWYEIQVIGCSGSKDYDEEGRRRGYEPEVYSRFLMNTMEEEDLEKER